MGYLILILMVALVTSGRVHGCVRPTTLRVLLRVFLSSRREVSLVCGPSECQVCDGAIGDRQCADGE